MTYITLIPPLFTNTAQYGAVLDGVTDDTAAINAALTAMSSAGGGWCYQTGLSAISAPITVPANCAFIGLGQATGLVQLASFSGGQMVNITGNYASVRDMSITAATSTYSGNPAADGIDMTGVTDTILRDLWLYYLNGWACASVATSGVANTHMLFDNVYSKQCMQGIHVLGVTGSGYGGTHKLLNCIMSGVQNGDCYLWEDVHDSLGTNLYGECSAGSGASFHFKGAVSAIDVSVFDIGPYPGPSTGSVIQFSAGPNGSPKNITIANGTIEGGTTGVAVNAGTFLTIANCKIFNNNTSGVNIAGSPGNPEVRITGCMFNQNGSAAGSGRYDIVNASSGAVYVSNNKHEGTQGGSANQVNAAVNDTGGAGYYDGNFYDPAAGWTATNMYASGGTPYQYRDHQGVPARGIITAPTFSGSPQTNTKAYDCLVQITGGTVSQIAIGGVNTNLTNGTFLVPAHTSISVTYSVAPTWVWTAINT